MENHAGPHRQVRLHSRRSWFWIMLVLITMSPSLYAAKENDALLIQGIQVFNEATDEWNRQRFEDAVAIFAVAQQREPNRVDPLYWEGVVQFHLVNLTLFGLEEQRDKDGAKQYLHRGMAVLEEAVEIDNRHGESHALLGTLIGISIYMNPLRGITRGKDVFKHFQLASQIAPENPRVYYLAGTSYLFTPAFLGGGVEKGVKYLLQAEHHFVKEAQQPAKPAEPRWGFSTCLAFLGRAYMEQDHHELARRYFMRALERHPGYQLALSGLEALDTKR